MTELPPAEPASWYRKHRPCAECKARVLNLIPRGALRVLHEESCSLVADKQRGKGSRTSTVQSGERS